jgi:hypothetical protein
MLREVKHMDWFLETIGFRRIWSPALSHACRRFPDLPRILPTSVRVELWRVWILDYAAGLVRREQWMRTREPQTQGTVRPITGVDAAVY